MTIPRIWTNGVASMPVDAAGRVKLTSADVSKLDGNEIRAVDKCYIASQNIAGLITLGDGGAISLDSSTSKFIASGANISTAGGNLVCGDSDVPQFSATRPRTVQIHLAEAFANFNASSLSTAGNLFPTGVSPTWNWYVDPATLMLQPGNHDTGAANAALIVPLSRIHDGAVNPTFSAYFVVQSGRTTLPARYPGVNVFRIDPFLGVVTSLTGWVYFATPANLAAYKNGATSGPNGTPNVVTATTTTTVDVSKYIYVAVVLDEDLPVADVLVPNEFESLSIESTISDMRFQ